VTIAGERFRYFRDDIVMSVICPTGQIFAAGANLITFLKRHRR